MKIDELISNFKKVGLSANEAKAYISLIKESPVTGYQLARNCGIVRSMIYEILGKLVDKGGVTVIKSKPDLYSPFPPDEFLSRLEREYEESAEYIKKELSKGFDDHFGDYFFNIQGRDNMVGKAIEMVNSAKKEIFISLGNADFLVDIRKDLVDAEQRGVRIVIFTFKKIPAPIGEVYSYGVAVEKVKEIFHSDRIILSVDQQQILIGQSSHDISDTKTIWTRNELLTSLVIEHIKHDIYLLRLRKMVGNDEFAKVLEKDDLAFNNKLVDIVDFDLLELNQN